MINNLLKVLSEPWNYRLLGQHVKNFLDITHKFKQPVVCRPEESLENVLQKMLVENVHRLYIINEERNLLGVLSSTDVLDYCLQMATMGEPLNKGAV
jgi:CBS-domain-containing membrane protein